MLQIQRNICVLFLATYFCLANVQAQASSARDYPNKTITMIVPFPPGGATDALARIVAQKLSSILACRSQVEQSI